MPTIAPGFSHKKMIHAQDLLKLKKMRNTGGKFEISIDIFKTYFPKEYFSPLITWKQLRSGTQISILNVSRRFQVQSIEQIKR